MNLMTVTPGQTRTISKIATRDASLDAFLFTLGCYSGEPITVVRRRKSGCTVAIKDGRYHMDRNLAEAIFVNEA